MLRDSKLWIFAASWLQAPVDSPGYKCFKNLGDSSLGELLFNEYQWQRSNMQFANSKLFFARRSYFLGPESENLFLLELFVKNYNARTKLKMVHE